MEKIFNQKNFNNFVWSPLGSRGNIYINFCLQVHFQVSAAWYCSHYFPPMSMTPVTNLLPVLLIPMAISTGVGVTTSKYATDVNNTSGTGGKIFRQWRWYLCHWCRWYRRQFASSVFDTGGKFATGVVDTGGVPWLVNISANFRKKFEMTLVLFSGAWGTVIHEKNLKQKISWHCPFKSAQCENFELSFFTLSDTIWIGDFEILRVT